MAGVAGFEPTSDGVKVRCLTAWLYPINDNLLSNLQGFVRFIESDPYGIRTRDTAVKGRCLNRLTKGPLLYCRFSK